jgi:hypothetical protein
VILAMEAGPEEAERITRDRIAGWLDHSPRALEPTSSRSAADSASSVPGASLAPAEAAHR